MKEFSKTLLEIIKKTQAKLKNDSQWKENFSKYITSILDETHYQNILATKDMFTVEEPFGLYATITELKQESSALVYSFRYLGQEIAKIRANAVTKFCNLNTKNYDETNERDFVEEDDLSLFVKDINEPYDSRQAKQFREYFIHNQPVRANNGNKNNEEHRIEFLLYKVLKQNKLVDFFPFSFGNAFVPMPTSISASSYSKPEKGRGNIDILGRAKLGNNEELTIIEVKIKDAATPFNALKQAAAYGTFIRELLRLEDAGQKWWNFWGMKGKIPHSVTIKLVCAMPKPSVNRNAYKEYLYIKENFPVHKIQLPNTNDYFELHGIFFDDNTEKGILENFEHTLNKQCS